MARVVLDQVEKVYGNGCRAIRDFDLAIEDGQLVALLGPSGCGKTTLLRMIAGLEAVTRGTIAFDGRVVNHVPPKDRDVAMVFQTCALYPHLDAYDNIAFSLRLRGVPTKAIQQRVFEAAALLGIEHLLERRPRELSGGEGQRVALGRAIARRPACFLLDEPLSSLDAPLRAELRAELKRLHQRLAVTTLYVTHDQEEAMTLGQRIAVVRAGQIQQVGDPLEVYRRPQNGFTAGFIGSPKMNFLPGTLVEDAGRLWFQAAGLRLGVPAWAALSLAARAGEKLVLGLRPEALSEKPRPGQADNELAGKVELVEPLGDCTDVHLSAPGLPRLIARLDSRTAMVVGSSGTLFADLDRLHFFSADPAAPNGAGDNVGP